MVVSFFGSWSFILSYPSILFHFALFRLVQRNGWCYNSTSTRNGNSSTHSHEKSPIHDLVAATVAVVVGILYFKNPDQATHLRVITETVHLRRPPNILTTSNDDMLRVVTYNNYVVFSTTGFADKTFSYGFWVGFKPPTRLLFCSRKHSNSYPLRIAPSTSINAVSFPSARPTKRFPLSRWDPQRRSFTRWNPRPKRSPNSNQLCSYCQR